MPELLRDGLESLRHQPQQQREMAHYFETGLRRHRHKMLGGLGGLGLAALAAVDALHGAGQWAWPRAAGALVLLAWACRR